MTDNSEKIRFWINGEALSQSWEQQSAVLLKNHMCVEMPCERRHATCREVYGVCGRKFCSAVRDGNKTSWVERLCAESGLPAFGSSAGQEKSMRCGRKQTGMTICVSTPSAPPVGQRRTAGMSPAQPSERASAAQPSELSPALRRPLRSAQPTVISARRWISVQRQLPPSSIGKAGLSGLMGAWNRSPCSERMSSTGWKLPGGKSR